MTHPRTWLVTGASRGLGRALAEAIVAAGENLVAGARDPGALAHLAGARVAPVTLDVTDPQAAERAVALAVDRFGTLDVVVNNAGYGNVGPIEETSLSDIRDQVETNLFGTINVTKAAIPLFRKQQAGHFVQISSIGGRVGAPGRAAYSAAKFGVESFSEVLASEMAPFGVRVTIVEPGGFRTDFAGSSTQISAGGPDYADSVAVSPPCSVPSTVASRATLHGPRTPSSGSSASPRRRSASCSGATRTAEPRRPMKPGSLNCAFGEN